jgi:signal recognition particle subunit SRP54
LDRLRRKNELSEAAVNEALREIRLALLEADVNFAIAKALLGRVRRRPSQ